MEEKPLKKSRFRDKLMSDSLADSKQRKSKII